MSIITNWRRFSKRYFLHHFLLSVIVSLSNPVIADHNKKISTTSSSIAEVEQVLSQIAEMNPRFIIRSFKQFLQQEAWSYPLIQYSFNSLVLNWKFSGFALTTEALMHINAFEPNDKKFSLLYSAENALQKVLRNRKHISHLNLWRHFSEISIDILRPTAGIWLVQQGGLRAGPHPKLF